jgi:hypothetical protein
VPEERLVRALAGQQHGHVSLRQAAELVEVEVVAVGQRLVVLPLCLPEPIQHAIGGNPHPVGPAAPSLRQSLRIGPLVRALRAWDRGGEGVERLRLAARELGGERARVQTARQEGTERHVAHPLGADGATEALHPALGPLTLARQVVGRPPVGSEAEDTLR